MWLSEQVTPSLHSEAVFREGIPPQVIYLMASQDPICTTARNRLCKVRPNITNSTLTQVKWQVCICKVASYKVSQSANCEKRRERFAELPLFLQTLGKKANL